MRGTDVSKIFSCAIIVVAISLPLSSCDLIEDTCKKTPNYQLCVSILRSDSNAPGADVTGLGIIMVNSLESTSTSAIKEIKNLLKTKPNLKAPLTQCIEKYKFIVKYSVPVAKDALRLGNPKFGEDSMNDAVIEIEICEEGFKSSSCPITGVTKNTKAIAAIAAAIIRILL